MTNQPAKTERNYAEVLFELTAPENRLARQDILKAWVEILKEVPELTDLVENPAFPEWERNKMLCDTMQEFCPGDQVMMDFIMEIAANRHLGQLANIVDHYSFLIQKAQGIMPINVFSAFPIDDEEKKQLTEEMEAALHSKLAITWHIDEAMIGGLVVKIGDVVIDNSVLGALQRVKQEMLN